VEVHNLSESTIRLHVNVATELNCIFSHFDDSLINYWI